MTAFVRYQCWNTERIGEVINMEAISVELAEFMATHAPLRTIETLRAPGLAQRIQEHDLLNELLRCAQQDRHMFGVIQGIPGTGKSHLIRWLYQRYLRDSDGRDEVLLIERAQNSLLGTLQQIIEKLPFDDDALQQQLTKLKSATASLSAKALADTVLDQLRIATYELEVPTKPRIQKNIEHFLLDIHIRDFLKRPEGPIERVTRFLSVGRVGTVLDDRAPAFEAADFVFPIEVLRAVRDEGNRGAKDLAEALNLKGDVRAELANYLNRLLDYAISHTAVLSADDLKQTFNELRRQFRLRGRGLVLLIEDITAFTGIDQGLIDVLVTQHTGEGNREFCRLMSVIGITDNYYKERFPDNLRERITHHLTLNIEGGVINDQDTAADLAARYLNAMRTDHLALRAWMASGGHLQHIPNPCDECPVKTACHAAFGAINIAADVPGGSIDIGLYPFNANAIWTMYQHLDTTTIPSTPRSFLRYVLLDFLQGNTAAITAGTFPPAPRELLPGIRVPPTLQKPVQQRVIDMQAGANANRVQTLLLFWGNRTADVYGTGADRIIGGISPTVFAAFGLSAIAGESGGNVPPPTPRLPRDQSGATPPVGVQQPPPTLQPATVSPPPPAPPPPAGTPYDTDIANWLQGGRLNQFEDLRKWLVGFIQEGIDWVAHGVQKNLLSERLSGRRICIEGQSGAVQGDHLLLKRSQELGYVLQALADLNINGKKLAPAAYGVHLATLGAWLRQQEADIVRFVRAPSSTKAEPMHLTELLILNALLLEWIGERLRVESTSARDLFGLILKSAGTEVADRQLTLDDWQKSIESAASVHSKAWTDTLKAIGVQRVKTCRSALLHQLSLPQGGSSDVRFVDAATVLDVLNRMQKRQWALRTITQIDDSSPVLWKDSVAVYTIFATRIDSILDYEKQHLQQHLQHLMLLMGDATPDVLIKAVEGLLQCFSTYTIPHTLESIPVKAPTLRNALNYVTNTLDPKQERPALAIRLSAAHRWIEELQTLSTYLERVVRVAKDQRDKAVQRMQQLDQEGDAQRLEAATMALYEQVITGLRERLHPAITEEPSK